MWPLNTFGLPGIGSPHQHKAQRREKRSRVRMMRISSPKAAVIGLLLVSGGAIVFRLWWASIPPKLPKGLRANSVWRGARTLPLPLPMKLAVYWNRVGAWESCWLDMNRNVDRCEFTDYKGAVLYQSDYTTCDGKPPVPDSRLQFGSRRQSFGFISLQDGTVLIPVNDCEIEKRSRSLDWCPHCEEPFPNLKERESVPNSR
jgi:hypothetical protein